MPTCVFFRVGMGAPHVYFYMCWYLLRGSYLYVGGTNMRGFVCFVCLCMLATPIGLFCEFSCLFVSFVFLCMFFFVFCFYMLATPLCAVLCVC